MSDKEGPTNDDDKMEGVADDTAAELVKDDDNMEEDAEGDDEETSAVIVSTPTEAEPTTSSSTTTITPRVSKKRGRSSPTNHTRSSPVPDGTTAAAQAAAAALSAQAVAAAAQAALSGGMTGLSTLLATSPHTMPTVDQVRQAATKAVNDAPPFVHMSHRDSAPQLKIEDHPKARRLVVRGGMRGYRMARATHGVSEGSYYFEVLVLPSPTARELTESLPSNVRLGKVLQQQLQDQLVREERDNFQKQKNHTKHNKSTTDDTATTTTTNNTTSSSSDTTANENKDHPSESPHGRKHTKKRKATEELVPPPSVGGHVRIGWSMRTGDLQAPVGYDKWSYGLRDIAGSRVHNSRREDHWGGEPFGPGDVVGFAISLVGSDGKSEDALGGSGGGSSGGTTTTGGGGTPTTTPTGTASSSSSHHKKSAPTATNHIRFFRNGEAMGHFVISKGKREGGAAFEHIQDGTYYPAVSSYMGGSVKVNFGPYFVYPPRMLPTGMKLAPMSDLGSSPPTPQEALAKALKECRSFSKKTDESIIQAFKDAIFTEAEIRHDAYQNHMSRHVEEVREARQERNISTSDLPESTITTTTTTTTMEEDEDQVEEQDDATDKMDVVDKKSNDTVKVTS